MSINLTMKDMIGNFISGTLDGLPCNSGTAMDCRCFLRVCDT